MFSWLGGWELTLQPSTRDVPGSISGSGKQFRVAFCFVDVVFILFVQNALHVFTQIWHFLFEVNSFSVLIILQNVWLVIRVWRYWPSIFNTSIPTTRVVLHMYNISSPLSYRLFWLNECRPSNLIINLSAVDSTVNALCYLSSGAFVWFPTQTGLLWHIRLWVDCSITRTWIMITVMGCGQTKLGNASVNITSFS